MANAFYSSYRTLLGGAGLDLTTADLRVVLVDLADYTYSAAHDFLDDVIAGARVAVSGTLGSVTFGSVAAGVLDAANVTLSAVTGDQSEALILYAHDGGADSARRLICYLDTGITGIPVTPNGGDITITWNASGIFSLGA